VSKKQDEIFSASSLHNLFFLFSLDVSAENKEKNLITSSRPIKDKQTGEELIGPNVNLANEY